MRELVGEQNNTMKQFVNRFDSTHQCMPIKECLERGVLIPKESGQVENRVRVKDLL